MAKSVTGKANPIEWATARAKQYQKADKNKKPWKFYTTKAWTDWRKKNGTVKGKGKKSVGNVVTSRKTNVTYNVPVAVPGKSAFGSVNMYSHRDNIEKLIRQTVSSLLQAKADKNKRAALILARNLVNLRVQLREQNKLINSLLR